MSSIFADAMRAAIYCNVSGCPPETDAQLAARKERENAWTAARRGICPAERYFYDDTLFCELLLGHAGDHVATEEYDDGDGVQMEVKWRNKP